VLQICTEPSQPFQSSLFHAASTGVPTRSPALEAVCFTRIIFSLFHACEIPPLRTETCLGVYYFLRSWNNHITLPLLLF